MTFHQNIPGRFCEELFLAHVVLDHFSRVVATPWAVSVINLPSSRLDERRRYPVLHTAVVGHNGFVKYPLTQMSGSVNRELV